MDDIAPMLIQAVTDEFHRLYDSSAKVKNLLAKVKSGSATYAEAQEYSLEVSRIIGVAYEKYVSSATLPDGRMYYNIAQRLIPSTLDENHELVSDYAAAVQKKLNEKAGISLGAQRAEQDQDRVDGLVDLASNAEQYDEVSNQLLTAFENFSQHIVDETIRKNAEFHYNAGLSPKIVRRTEGKCCPWCRGLAGIHDYPDVDRDVYRRHENCRCTVLYDPADGSSHYQNVWSKRRIDQSKIEERKLIAGVDKTKKVREIEASAKPKSVYAEYMRNASPGNGSISYDSGYDVSGHRDEISFAKWLYDTLGGEIKILSESEVEGEKRADFQWNGRFWDLKKTTTPKSADSALRKGLKQIAETPGGIFLDYGDNEVSIEDVIPIVDSRMKRGKYESADVMIISHRKILKIIRYKK